MLTFASLPRKQLVVLTSNSIHRHICQSKNCQRCVRFTPI